MKKLIMSTIIFLTIPFCHTDIRESEPDNSQENLRNIL
jgi:hypothetical protein